MVLEYKVLSFAVFAVFFWFVFDIRQKPGMVPLIALGWTTVMKVLSLVVMSLYGYLLAKTAQVDGVHWVSLGLTLLGASLVTTAKLTLGRQHTWAGYHLEKTRLVSRGIYSRIRHPLYTGIFLFEFGGLTLILRELGSASVGYYTGVALAFAYLMGFNIVTAGAESRNLAKQFGSDYQAYRARVRAFIPIRRRTDNAIADAATT